MERGLPKLVSTDPARSRGGAGRHHGPVAHVDVEVDVDRAAAAAGDRSASIITSAIGRLRRAPRVTIVIPGRAPWPRSRGVEKSAMPIWTTCARQAGLDEASDGRAVAHPVAQVEVRVERHQPGGRDRVAPHPRATLWVSELSPPSAMRSRVVGMIARRLDDPRLTLGEVGVLDIAGVDRAYRGQVDVVGEGVGGVPGQRGTDGRRRLVGARAADRREMSRTPRTARSLGPSPAVSQALARGHDTSS